MKESKINAREVYLNWIVYNASLDEIREQVNKIIDKENSEESLDNMTMRLKEEIKQIDLLLVDSNPEEILILEEEKKLIQMKQEVIDSTVQAYENSRKRELTLESLRINNGVLFATNEYGNIMIERDLRKIKKSCSEETYNKFLKLINELFIGKDNFDETKQKPVGSDNETLKGIYEKKNYQSRIIYRYARDCIVIIGATLKKTDLNSKYRTFCVNAKEKSESYIRKIKSNSADIEMLTKQSLEFYDKIFINRGGLKK